MNHPFALPLVALMVGLAISIAITPFARRLAFMFGLVDYPDNLRKLHRQPIARCGGISILATLLISFGLVLVLYPEQATHLVRDSQQALSLGLGAIAIVGLGVVDDRSGLRGRQKLAVQVLICMGIIAFGFSIEKIQIFGYPFELGMLAWPVTLLWLLLCINSINLIDGADGLCSTVGWISFAAVSVICAFTGNHIEGIIAASLAGALLGFLFYNLPPASVFLGDSGSMLVGLFLGVLTMRSWFSEGSSMSITIPLVLMAIPLFDSSMAVLRRKLTGRSVFTVDRGHLHHNLMRHGFHDRALVGIIALLSSVTAAGAVAGVILKSDLISIATMVFALGSLVVSKLFGFAELKMLYLRIERMVTSLISPPKRNMHGVHQEVVQLQGTRNWDTVWSTLVEFAEKHELAQLSLDLNMPWLHEGYHAAWKKNILPEYSERWTLRLPLKHQGRIFGHLEFIGKQQEEETLSTIARLTELLDVMQTDLQALIQDFEEKRGTTRHLDDEVRSPVPGQPVPNL